MHWLTHIPISDSRNNSYRFQFLNRIKSSIIRGIKLIPIKIPESEYGEDIEQGKPNTFLPRPSLPPLFVCALSLWLTCALLINSSIEWSIPFSIAIGIFGVLGSLACLVFLFKVKNITVTLVFLGCLLGICMSGFYAYNLQQIKANTTSSYNNYSFRATSDSSKSLYGYTCFAETTLDSGKKVVVHLQFSNESTLPRYGESIKTKTTLEVASSSSASYLWNEGCVLKATIVEFEFEDRKGILGSLVGLRNKAIDLISSEDTEGAGVLAALTCGWRDSLEEDVYHAFKVTGLAHIIAVSGAHLSIVSTCILSGLKFARVPYLFSKAAVVFLLICYLIFTAASPSVLRAAAMTVLGLLSFFAARRPASLNALLIFIVLCMAFSPELSLSVSFILSVLATLGIILFSRLMGLWINCVIPFLPIFAREALALTSASSLLATPYSAALFAQIPLIAGFANVVIAPMFPLVCTAGLLALSLSFMVPPLAPVLITLACAVTDLLVNIVTWLGTIPYASIPLDLDISLALFISALLASLLWFWWPQPHKVWIRAVAIFAVLGILGMIMIPARFGPHEIIMLDVGQGDAFLIRSQGSAILVDTGNKPDLLYQALARQGVYHLDALLITHGDDDHRGCLTDLKGVVDVDNVVVAQGTTECQCNTCIELLADSNYLVGNKNVHGVEVGDRLEVGVFTLSIIWPYEFSEEGGNADSLCFLLECDIQRDNLPEWNAFFAGDAEEKEVKAMLAEGSLNDIDVYKVGHHGAASALLLEQAEILRPEISLVSSGKNNSYGHPSTETLEILNTVKSSIYNTAEDSDVSCVFLADRIEITTLG